jgi:hypothetical protein
MKLPRFTLRNLIWLVLIVAMGLGWWIQSRESQHQLDLQRQQYEESTRALVIRLMSHGGYMVDHDHRGRYMLRYRREVLGPFE